MKLFTKGLAVTLSAAMAFGVLGYANNADAKKASVAKKTLKIEKGSSQTISIKNKNKKAKYSFKSSKKSVATVTSKGKVKAIKLGSAVITVKEKIKRKIKKIGTVKVTVIAKKSSNNTTNNATNAPTVEPTAAPTAAPTVEPTVAPTAAPTAEPTFKPVVDDEKYVTQDDFTALGKAMKDAQTGEQRYIYYDSTTCNLYKDANGEGGRRATVFLPAGYDDPANADKKYPVVYALHGNDGNDDSDFHANYELRASSFLNMKDGKYPEYLQGAANEEIILVRPNCRCYDMTGVEDPLAYLNSQYFGPGTNYSKNVEAFNRSIDDITKDLMPYINATFRTKTGRKNTAICGLSMGGRTSLYIGLNHPELFGYIGAFEPAPGAIDLFPSRADFAVKDEYKDSTYILISKGTSDNIVGDNPINYRDLLKQNGATVHYYESPGGHDPKVWSTSLYNFMARVFY